MDKHMQESSCSLDAGNAILAHSSLAKKDLNAVSGKLVSTTPATSIHRRDSRRRVRSQCTEAVLFRLLKRVPPELRLAMLSHCFSQQQRLALERWILMQRSLPKHRRAEQPRFLWHSSAGIALAAARIPRHTKVCQSPAPVSIYQRATASYVSYLVKGVVGPFAIFARSTHHRRNAFQYQRLLRYLQSRFFAAIATSSTAETAVPTTRSDHSSDAIEQAFREALADSLARYGEDLFTNASLCFTAAVPAGYWIGRALSTPRYAVMKPADLGTGLRAWKRLSAARGLVKSGCTNRYTILAYNTPDELEAAWQQLKLVYMEIWTRAGRSPSNTAAQLTKLEDRHSQCRRRLIERWLLFRPRASQQQKRLLLQSNSWPSACKRRCVRSGSCKTHWMSVLFEGEESSSPVPDYHDCVCDCEKDVETSSKHITCKIEAREQLGMPLMQHKSNMKLNSVPRACRTTLCQIEDLLLRWSPSVRNRPLARQLTNRRPLVRPVL